AHDDHRVLHRSSGQSGFDRHHCHRLVAGGLPVRPVGHKATLHRVDRAHYPLGWIGDHREQFCPVSNLVTAQLKRSLQGRIKQAPSSLWWDPLSGWKNRLKSMRLKAPTAPFSSLAMTIGSAPRSVKGYSTGRRWSAAVRSRGESRNKSVPFSGRYNPDSAAWV